MTRFKDIKDNTSSVVNNKGELPENILDQEPIDIWNELDKLIKNKSGVRKPDYSIFTEAQNIIIDSVLMVSLPSLASILKIGVEEQDEVIGKMQQEGTLLGLRLSENGASTYPEFQVNFSENCIYPIVEQVNIILGAKDEPWAIASWWSSPHARLDVGESPMNLIGTEKEQRLIKLAHSVRGER